MFICFLNGFTAGLPLFYLIQLIPIWLRDQQVDLKVIGTLGLAQISYNWKFVWSPVLDRFVLPLGRRRGWMLLSQVLIFLSMASLSLCDPHVSMTPIVCIAVAMAFCSATQDIALDAYRREVLTDEELGLGNSMYANAYRIAGFIPGGLAVILADHLPWPTVHLITACFCLVGIGMTLWISEPVLEHIAAPKTMKEAVVLPFKEFFARSNFKSALLILAFMFFYKFGDVLATALQSPFFLDVGFTKTIIGSVVKGAGITSSLVGGLFGGIFIYKIGINRCLWIFGFIQMCAISSFALLSTTGPVVSVLAVVVSLEYFAVGLGTSALVAYMASTTNRNFTATQFALFSSLIAVPRTLSGSIAGFLIEGFNGWKGLGYTNFFYVCMVCSLPGMILLKWVAPWNEKPKTN